MIELGIGIANLKCIKEIKINQSENKTQISNINNTIKKNIQEIKT
jgi:hypothetical protein